MEHYLPFLNWIDHQKTVMKELVIAWSNINTHAMNAQGLEKMKEAIKSSFEALGGTIQELQIPSYVVVDEHGNKSTIPLGKVIHITKRSDSPFRILLAGHMDTVYSKNSPFQQVLQKDENTLVGPGVSDMKGGLAIMLMALQAFEKSPYASKIGWEVIINPDEEIGSPGASSLYERAAKRNQLGLLFEPAFGDGSIVIERAGSMNLVVVIRGKSAHAGRDFEQGRSAIYAAAALIVDLEKLNAPDENCIVSVGECRSGNSFNVIPDLAIVRINARAHSIKKMEEVKNAIYSLVEKHSTREGITMEVIIATQRQPKVKDSPTEKVLEWLTQCANDLQQPLRITVSRGVTDGNILQAAGLPTIDSLGVIGGALHTHNEYLQIDSLVSRAKLTALLLMRLGNGEFAFESKDKVISL